MGFSLLKPFATDHTVTWYSPAVIYQIGKLWTGKKSENWLLKNLGFFLFSSVFISDFLLICLSNVYIHSIPRFGNIAPSLLKMQISRFL